MPVCSEIRSTAFFEPFPDLRHVVDGEPAQLHLLAGGDVGETFAVFAADFPPRVRSCIALMMPLGMRGRIMKWPGVWRRKKTPAHLSRSLSPSVIVSQPSAA